METTQGTYVTLSTTDHVSVNEWRGLASLRIKETRDVTLEVSNIETDELLRAISYFVRNLATNPDRTGVQTRILADMNTSLTTALEPTKTEAAA